MTRDDLKWELEMKADRVLYRLTAEQMSYLGDDFPWAITDDDLKNDGLVDVVRRRALHIGRAASMEAAQVSSACFSLAV